MNNKALTIKEIFTSSKYIIPDYQRNFAWDMDQVEPLIQDIAGYAKESISYKGCLRYYIGNLIVEKRNEKGILFFETIDGQQRLTTLYILLSALKNHWQENEDFCFFEKDSLSFTYRDDSDNSLKILYDDVCMTEDEGGRNYEKHILTVYNELRYKPLINQICEKEGISLELFTSYMLNNVCFLRIPLPEGVDKNHYFEVMNSCGLQLEKHEIIKSDLLSFLQDDGEYAQSVFDELWTACSQMERYVQMNIINTDKRSVIFDSTWEKDPFSKLNVNKTDKSKSEAFDLICREFSKLEKDNYHHNPNDSYRMIDILNDFKVGNFSKYEKLNGGDDDTYLPEQRFYSVIDFPNFLLHVLKVMYPSSKSYSDITMDDKRLDESFKSIFSTLPTKDDKRCFAKVYLINLLQCRYLFDKFSLRRDRMTRDEERWCVKQLKQAPNSTNHIEYVNTFGSQQDEIEMLLCVFHVSATARIRKNWLQGILAFSYNNPAITATEYRIFLKNLAAAYMRDNYLNERTELLNIIYTEDGLLKCRPEKTEINLDLIDGGVDVERFIFNYYEYILWLEDKKPYQFTYRRTVEHFFPQDSKDKSFDMPKTDKDKFGNLCLLSNKINPKFSNSFPYSKITDYPSYFDNNLKLQRMMQITKDPKKEIEDIPEQERWFIADINKEEILARNLLMSSLFEDTEIKTWINQ